MIIIAKTGFSFFQQQRSRKILLNIHVYIMMLTLFVKIVLNKLILLDILFHYSEFIKYFLFFIFQTVHIEFLVILYEIVAKKKDENHWSKVQ